MAQRGAGKTGAWRISHTLACNLREHFPTSNAPKHTRIHPEASKSPWLFGHISREEVMDVPENVHLIEQMHTQDSKQLCRREIGGGK
jgi:hypothetical protein